MSILTTLTRMWLTRSTQPFLFTSDFDSRLQYEDCNQLGLYVHIPFCKSICSFCPYCKTLYSPQACQRYIDALLQEIHLVGQMQHTKRPVTSLYFGGGSPALAVERLAEIVTTLGHHFEIKEGIGLELHPSDVTVDTLTRLRAAGVTKISIGIQSFSDKFLAILGRRAFDTGAMKTALAAVPFETVSMDFIFALPGQTFEDLQGDIERAVEIGANHFAIYPFISFAFTNSSIPPMGKGKKKKLLDAITLYCREQGYHRDSIWTFSISGNEKYSSMTRDNFLGFGCSATTLLREQFKVNTFGIQAYQQRLQEGKLPTSLTIRFTLRQRMLYYLFWTAYTTRISLKDFAAFFGRDLKSVFGLELWLAQKLGFAAKSGDAYEMTLKGAFYYHYYESYYTLSYIDKMWGIMRDCDFPKKISF